MTTDSENKKTLKYRKDSYFELQLLVAEVNAKGIASFLDDFFIAWVMSINVGENLIDVDPIVFKSDDDVLSFSNRIKVSTLYELRIVATKAGLSLKQYMESVVEWLANEHRENGRFWFDDTPRNALPIRTRRL